jgi:hypothetical protein
LKNSILVGSVLVLPAKDLLLRALKVQIFFCESELSELCYVFKTFNSQNTFDKKSVGLFGVLFLKEKI